MKVAFQIAYNGSNYAGWQRQSLSLGIQEVVESCLSKILKEDIRIVGCGRTDAGVHAENYTFHTHLAQWPEFDLVKRLNRILPADVSAKKVVSVDDNFNARFSAQKRTYQYRIHSQKDPFKEKTSSYYDSLNLNLESLAEAASWLIKHSDFRHLCRTPDRHKSTLCKIFQLEWAMTQSGYVLNISANRFLKSMVRVIVHDMILLGTNQWNLEQFKNVVINGDRKFQIALAPPNGLYLMDVTYPSEYGLND